MCGYPAIGLGRVLVVLSALEMIEYPGDAPDFRKSSATLQINIESSANGQKHCTVRCDFHKRSRETLLSGEPFVRNEDENAKYKKSLFLH